MKKSRNRKIAMIMTFLLIIPLFGNMNTAVASAATPTFIQSNVEIVGADETYPLEIKDKVTGSKYTWTTSNKTVATVTDKGIITSVNKGTATIKCKITYPSKKTKTLSCKVTVTIPATEITISNASDEVNGAHVMLLGSTMDFNCDLAPLNTSDKVFWSVGGGDPSCIRIDNAESGQVTATKPGKVILKATAAKSSTKEAADLSIVDDAIIIEVVGLTATVKSAEITESNEITVVFDSAVNPSTVIGTNSALSENIEITLSKDTKNVVAADPGKLTASLSDDSKTLTITSEKPFSGYYGINFTSKILTVDGTALEQYYKKMTYIDIAPPEYLGTTLDDTGLIATINFTEPLDFSHMVISDVKLITTKGETADAYTLSILRDVINYSISKDEKSLMVDLTNIASGDKGKTFSIIISGITDKAGNLPAKNYINILVYTDNSYKPQAKPLFIVRTGYKTLTATFDRAVSFGGYLQIEGGSSIIGIVDSTDKKKVNYEFSDAEALYTGVKKVSIGYWNGFNVNPTDNYANRTYDYMVGFAADKTSPVLITYSFDVESGILTLQYNEDVTLTSDTGVFATRFTSASEEVRSINVNYSVVAHSEGKNIIKLKLTNISLMGDYIFALEQGFAIDNFRNLSIRRDMLISNGTGTASELPGPVIEQSTSNPNQIVLRFMTKLDKATAETTSNYKIMGIPIVKAELTLNTDSGATVTLTVADNSIEYNLSYQMTITGVKGYNNKYSAITSYSTSIPLKENKKPVFNPVLEFDRTTKNIVKVNFDEPIQGTFTVKVTQAIGGTSAEIQSSTAIVGSSIVISLASIPNNNSALFIDVIYCDIKDLNGNAVTSMPARLWVIAAY